MSASKTYRILAFLALVVCVFTLVETVEFLLLFSAQVSPIAREGRCATTVLAIGALSIFLGLVGPLRVGLSGAMIPLQIKSMLRVLGFCLLAGGVGALLTTQTSPWIALVGRLVMAGAAGICAVAAFYRLSTQLPQSLTVREMLVTIQSASLFGAQSETVVDREYRRWTGGKTKGVAVGKEAVDGLVYSLQGQEEKLSNYFEQETLLVVNFASYTCPIHRKRLVELEALMQKWQSREVRFVTVYTAEAHPVDGWNLEGQFKNDAEYNGVDDDFCFLQPQTLAERLKMARWLVEKKKWEMPVVVDSMQNTLLSAYNTWPIRLYVFKAGKVVFEGEQGPFGYNTQEVDAFLEEESLL